MKRVIVYSTPQCPWCTRIKEFLGENGISYEEKDVSVDHAAAHEMVDKSGQMGVPVTDVEGQIIVGFNEAALRQALEIN